MLRAFCGLLELQWKSSVVKLLVTDTMMQLLGLPFLSGKWENSEKDLSHGILLNESSHEFCQNISLVNLYSCTLSMQCLFHSFIICFSTRIRASILFPSWVDDIGEDFCMVHGQKCMTEETTFHSADPSRNGSF